MSTSTPTIAPPAVKARPYLVQIQLASGSYRSVRVPSAEGSSDALCRALASLTPPPGGELAGASVDGRSFDLAARLPERLFWVPDDAGPAERERLAAERVLVVLRAADDALAALAAAALNPRDAAAARYEGRAVCETAARVRDLATRRGGK